MTDIDPIDFVARITAGYAANGPTLDLGRGIINGTLVPDAAVQLPLSMMSRHGLIAGATGTGKTKTLQLLVEQLSDAGVPTFAADIKGDLTGLSQPGEASAKLTERVNDLKLQWLAAGKPVSFLSLGGIGTGVPVRAAVSSFGPTLLAKVLGANDTQRSALSMVFHYADSVQLALLDLDDVRAVLQYLTSDAGKAEREVLGGLSKQTAGVLLRKIVELHDQGADDFFGEPELDIADLMRTTPDGKGVATLLELSAVQDRPKLFSTFLMWLLGELFEHLPEVGDLDKPKLVFFFDEAHLLFNDAPKDFIDQVAQTVRLIRSKGVGVFFITQLPDDVPNEVLAQLGNRVQHALRAFTPRDAKALKAAVTTYPKTADYDLEETLTQLGIGEAVITTLTERGTPTPVVWTRMRPPSSLMAAIAPDAVAAAVQSDPLLAKYATEVDRDSAREILTAKLAPPQPPPATTSSAPAQSTPPARAPEPRAPEPRAPEPRAPGPRPAPQPSRERPRGSGKGDDNPITDFLGSREGRATMNTVLRGVFGLLKKR